MAGNKITRKDIVEDKVLNIGSDYAKSLQHAIDANEKWLQSFKPIKEAALAQANLSNQFKVAQGQKEFLQIKKLQEEAIIKSNNALKSEQQLLIAKQKAEQSVIDTEKKALSLTNQKLKSQQQSVKLSAQEKLEISLLNRGKREAAVISSKLSTEYERQSKILLQLRRKYKDVALTQGESSKQAKNLLTNITALDSRLKRVDANVGQFQRNVGNYGKAMQSARNAARGLASALGLVGGAFLVVQVARDATKVLKDFEKQNATLSAILQVEKEEMKGLSDEAIRLGSITVKTAGEVTALQIAYARLGFSQSEIIDLTEATINGSIALNAELDRTANLTGAVVNTFDDFSTADAPKILDILSLSTAKSALNFEKLEAGIPIVAGAANAAGIPFTKLIALMGKLSDSGIDVSTSSTALRNIFIESAAQGLNYGEILEKIKDSQDKLTASNDEFGKRAAVSAAVLSNNIDKTNELDEALNNAAGTAERMANKELDTLDGSLKLLRSAWEGYILGANESGGASEKLKDLVKGLADNLEKILDTTVKAVKAFVIYKAILISISLLTTGYTKAVTLLRIAKIALTGGINGATRAMKLFNIATKANPIGLLLSVLAGGVAIWYAFKDGATEAAGGLSEFNKEVERLEGLGQRFTKALGNVAEGQERANAAVLESFNSQDKLEKSLRNQGVNESRIATALKLVTSVRETDIEAIDRQIDRHATYTDSQKKQIRSAIIVNQTLQKIIDENTDFEDTRRKEKLKKIQEESEKERKARLAIEKQLRKDAFDLSSFLLNQKIKEQEEISENEKIAFEKRKESVVKQGELELELARLTAEYKLNEIEGFDQKEIDQLLDKNNLSLEETRKYTDEQLLIYREFQAKKRDIQRGTEDGEDSLDVERLKSEAEIQKAIKEKQLNDEIRLENELFLKKQGIYADVENATAEREKRIFEIKKRYALEALDVQVKAIESLLKTEEISTEERAKLEERLSSIKLEISDINTNQWIDDNEKLIESEHEKTQRILQLASELAGALNDLTYSIFDAKIQKIDEEIDASDAKYERLLDNELLSEEQRKSIEEKQEIDRQKLEKKKKEEQRKQAVLAKITTAFGIALSTASAIISALAAPPVGLGPVAGIPLSITAGAIGAIQLAAALAAPIPAYVKGTDDHPGGKALVGEIRPEVIQEPNKAPYVISSPTVVDLPRHTKVTPSLDEYYNLLRASMLSSVEIDNNKLNTFQAKVSVNNNFDVLVKEMQLTRDAIKNQKKQPIHIHEKTIDINHAIWAAKNIKWNG